MLKIAILLHAVLHGVLLQQQATGFSNGGGEVANNCDQETGPAPPVLGHPLQTIRCMAVALEGAMATNPANKSLASKLDMALDEVIASSPSLYGRKGRGRRGGAARGSGGQDGVPLQSAGFGAIRKVGIISDARHPGDWVHVFWTFPTPRIRES